MAVGVHNGTASLRMRLVPSPSVASTARAIVASALHRATAGPSRCGRTAEVFALASLRRLSLSRLRFDLPAPSNSGSRYGGYSGGYSEDVGTDTQDHPEGRPKGRGIKTTVPPQFHPRAAHCLCPPRTPRQNFVSSAFCHPHFGQ
jgi:hypothetical protein